MKIYDVAQAKKDLAEAVDGWRRIVEQSLSETLNKVIAQLEVHAEALSDSNEIAALIDRASFVHVEPIGEDLKDVSGARRISEICVAIETNNGSRRYYAQFSSHAAVLPAVPHRMIVFFLPVKA